MTSLKHVLGECRNCGHRFEYYQHVTITILPDEGETKEEFLAAIRRSESCPKCGSEDKKIIEIPPKPPVTPHDGQEYMGVEHLEFFRDRLDERKEELLLQQETYFLEWLAPNRLQLVQHAIDRLAEGRYGYCEYCDEPIGLDVLKGDCKRTKCRSCPFHQARVVAGVLNRDGKYLVVRKRDTDREEDLWEFPGGKVERGESYFKTLDREWLEQLGVHEIEFAHQMADYENSTTFGEFRGIRTEDEPVAKEHSELRWASLQELETLDMRELDKRFVLETLKPFSQTA